MKKQKKDEVLTRGVLLEVLAEALKEQDARFDQKLVDLRLDIRDEIHSVVSASETRTMKKMDEMGRELRKEMHGIKEEIIDGITDVLDESVLPQLDEHAKDIRLIKQRLALT